MNKNIINKVLSWVMLIVIFSNSIYALSTGPISSTDLNKQSGGAAAVAAPKVVSTAKNIWATAASVVQILAVAAIVFAGLRYMFAAADTKADIKKQTIVLMLGAVLVFSAVTFLGVISDAINGTGGAAGILVK